MLMDIFLQVVLLIVGFVLLIKGADFLIDGASGVARKFKISPSVIGLTIVAFGTSAPELAVSISAILSGNTDLTVGNVLGSGILNILLLLGVAAVMRPIVAKESTVRKELPLCILVTLLFSAMILDVLIDGAGENVISRGDGVILLLFFCIFLYYLISLIRRNRGLNEEPKRGRKKKDEKKFWVYCLMTLGGLVGVIVGSDLVVSSASNIAEIMGLSERLIALTVVAIGTSLPELVTTITASKKGEQELLIGNIVGSNIFNICIVIGLPVVIFGGFSVGNFQPIDLIMFIASSIILYIFAKTKGTIGRLEGALMLVFFAVYYTIMIMTAI